MGSGPYGECEGPGSLSFELPPAPRESSQHGGAGDQRGEPDSREAEQGRSARERQRALGDGASEDIRLEALLEAQTVSLLPPAATLSLPP